MPVSTTTVRLGDLERAVMEHLWSAGPQRPEGTTVRDVLDMFRGEREIAYTTVMTVLDRLSKKGLVTRERSGRAWVYQPAGTREELTAETVRRTLDDLDVTDRRAALLHFLHGATSRDLDDLRAAMAEAEARLADSPDAAAAAASTDASSDGRGLRLLRRR